MQSVKSQNVAMEDLLEALKNASELFVFSQDEEVYRLIHFLNKALHSNFDRCDVRQMLHDLAGIMMSCQKLEETQIMNVGK